MPKSVPGVVEAGALYQLDEVKARLGVGKAAWRRLLNLGFPVIRIGRRGYVQGSDAIDFLSNLKTKTSLATAV